MSPTFVIPPTQAATSGYRDNNGIHSDHWESREAWSELFVIVDNHLLARVASDNLRGPGTLRIRCETNVYSLYRDAAELDVHIVDDAWTMHGIAYAGGGIVSPTIDLRGGNDPGNSALTGGGGVKVLSRAANVFLFSCIALICRVFSSWSWHSLPGGLFVV